MCKINGRKLKEIREREGLTLQDVAKNCGVSYSTISKYESEINNPSYETVDKICFLLIFLICILCIKITACLLVRRLVTKLFKHTTSEHI